MRSKNTSILILTHHKAASTLLRRLITSTYSFKYKSIDYAGNYWKASPADRRWESVYHMLNKDPCKYFRQNGFIYGPLRLPVNINVNDFKRVIIARNPVDTLTSEFVSFAYTHPIPKSGKAKEKFLKRRTRILSSGLDQYALENIDSLYERQSYLFEASPGAMIIPYSRLSTDTNLVIKNYSRYVESIIPHYFIRNVIKIREMISNADIHKSRLKNYEKLSLPNSLKKNITNKFSKFEFLY